MEETTSELPKSSSDTRQDWTSPIPSSVAFEILPIDTVMESFYGEFARTSEEPQTNDAFSSEMTSAGYQGTVSAVSPSSTPNDQFTISENSSVAEEISTESDIFSDELPSTIEVIPPLILTTAQETTGLQIEHGNLDSVSSMTSIEGTQFPADFYLSTPSAPIREDPPLEKFRLPVKLSVPEPSSVILESVAPTEDPAFSSTLQHASAFDSTDTYFPTEQFSTSFRPIISSSNSPLFSEYETESGEQSNDVSTRTPIFDEASGDSTSTSTEETDNDNSLSTTTTPSILSDASTMDTKLVGHGNSNLFSTINFSWETSQSEITSPLPDESKIHQSFDGALKPTEYEFASPREEDLFSSVGADFSTSSHVSSSSVTTDSSVTSSFQSTDTSTEPHDGFPSVSTNSPLFSEFEMGSGDESINVPTLKPIFENEGSGEDITTTVEELENVTPGFLNATDSPSHQMAISGLPSEFAETSPEGSGFEPTLLPNLVDIASTFIIPDMIEVSTERLPSSPTGNSDADVSDADSQLVSREIYHTTSPSIVVLPIKETASSFIPLVTDENGGSGDSTPLFDTLKPTENEFGSPREEDLFSSVGADFSTLSHVSSEQIATALPSSSSVTTEPSLTSSFQSIDTSTELHSASTSFEPSVSSTISPLSSKFEMGSGDESIYVPTEIPIFENEGSGEDSTSTLEAEAATDQSTINISEIDSTINPLSSSLTDNVSESSTTESFSLVSSSPDSSTEIPYLSSAPLTVSDIPSEPSTSQSTFSQSSTSLSSQSFTSEVDTVSSVAFSDSNTITSSTAAWNGASSESSFGSSSASAEPTSSSSTSTISITTSNTTHSNISTDEWINASDGTTKVLSTTESTTVSSSNFTTSLSASTISHSTSSLSSSVEPVSTTVKYHSTTPSFHTTKSSLSHSEIPTTTTTDPLSNLWNLLVSKLNESISLPFSGEYSYASNFFWSNTTSSNLNGEDIKEIPSPSISSPIENTGIEILLLITNAQSNKLFFF